MAGDPGSLGAWERYVPWEGTYRVLDSAEPLGRRHRRVLRLLVAAWFVAAVWWAVDALRSEGWGALVTPLVWLLLGVGWEVFSARRPAGTRVAREGLAVRDHPFRTRTASWVDVVEVRPRGRFGGPAAVLASGEHLPLVGVPDDVAEAMAAVTRRPLPDRSPRDRPSPPARRLAPGEDLDGPFLRGWSGGRGGRRV